MYKSIDEIKEFVRKRDEMLNKFDVNEFIQWSKETNPQLHECMLFLYNGKNLEKWIMTTMCELCLMSTGVAEEVKEKARKELERLDLVMKFGEEE